MISAENKFYDYYCLKYFDHRGIFNGNKVNHYNNGQVLIGYSQFNFLLRRAKSKHTSKIYVS